MRSLKNNRGARKCTVTRKQQGGSPNSRWSQLLESSYKKIVDEDDQYPQGGEKQMKDENIVRLKIQQKKRDEEKMKQEMLALMPKEKFGNEAETHYRSQSIQADTKTSIETDIKTLQSFKRMFTHIFEQKRNTQKELNKLVDDLREQEDKEKEQELREKLSNIQERKDALVDKVKLLSRTQFQNYTQELAEFNNGYIYTNLEEDVYNFKQEVLILKQKLRKLYRTDNKSERQRLIQQSKEILKICEQTKKKLMDKYPNEHSKYVRSVMNLRLFKNDFKLFKDDFNHQE